jgi:hypothetical protein
LWRSVKYEDVYIKDYGSVAELEIGLRNVSMILRHFFREITVEAFPPPVAPACVLLGRQAY